MEPRFTFERFTFDTSPQELRKDGRRVKLKPQPAKLLALLLRHRGEIVHRDEIRKALWDDSTFVDIDRSINSCVRQIRTALGDDAGSPRFIETIPREGYRFIAAEEVSSASPAIGSDGRRSARRYVAAALAAAVVLTLVLWPSRPTDPVLPDATPSVIVFGFDNLSNDPSLDWLRVGLADMLITNLSQGPGLQVISTDRMFQFLDELGVLDEPVTSQRVVENVAGRAGADTAVLGSFLRAGEAIRINLRVQDVASGEILTTATVQGDDEAGLFAMADELSRHVRANLNFPRATREHVAPRLAELTTSSIEAYRYFVEAWELLKEGKSSEALALFESAVEIDPRWARALAMVSMMHNNLGHEKEAEEFALRALALSESLEPRLRYVIETWHYARQEETYGRAIEVGEKLLDLEPNHNFRHIVGRRLLLLERTDEAIQHGQVFRRTRRAGLLPWASLSRAYALQGRFEEGHEVLEELLEESPDSAGGYRSLGAHLAWWGKLDAALEAVDKSEELSRNPLGPDLVRWEISVLRGQWEEASAAVKPRTSLKDPTLRWDGLRRLAVVALYRGHSQEALSLLDEAIGAYDDRRARSAQARNEKARLLLAMGRPATALEEAILATREGHGHFPEWEGLFLAAKAQARLGEMEAAMTTASKLRERTASIPSDKETRRHHHLLGELALARGETESAIAELERARSMLLPRGIQFADTLPQHAVVWFSLARAYRAAGQNQRAAVWLERIVDGSTERVWWPIEYARSLYFLGKIYEAERDLDLTYEYYGRFYELWKDGDLDRGRIDDVERQLRESRLIASQSDDAQLLDSSRRRHLERRYGAER